MTTQLALDFTRAKGQGPETQRCHVDKMIELLRGKDWQTARDLGAAGESERRILRALAEESEGEIISGQKGYKLTRESTIEEVAGAGWLKSQGKKMVHRWIQIQRVYHRALQPQG